MKVRIDCIPRLRSWHLPEYSELHSIQFPLIVTSGFGAAIRSRTSRPQREFQPTPTRPMPQHPRRLTAIEKEPGFRPTLELGRSPQNYIHAKRGRFLIRHEIPFKPESPQVAALQIDNAPQHTPYRECVFGGEYLWPNNSITYRESATFIRRRFWRFMLLILKGRKFDLFLHSPFAIGHLSGGGE